MTVNLGERAGAALLAAGASNPFLRGAYFYGGGCLVCQNPRSFDGPVSGLRDGRYPPAHLDDHHRALGHRQYGSLYCPVDSHHDQPGPFGGFLGFCRAALIFATGDMEFRFFRLGDLGVLCGEKNAFGI